MKKIDKVISDINASGSEPILIHRTIPGSESFLILKKSDQVYHDDSRIYNLKGIEIQVDSDWGGYGMNIAGKSGISLYDSTLSSESSVKNNIIIGDEESKKYLKDVDQWDVGINFEEKWDGWVWTVDTYINNKLKP